MSLVFRPITKEYWTAPFDCKREESDMQAMMNEAYLATITKQAVVFNCFMNEAVVAQVMISLSVIKDNNYTWTCGHEQYAAMKIQYLVVRPDMRHKGIGTQTMNFAITYIKKHIEGLPIRFIFLEAVQERVEWFKGLGFESFAEGMRLQNPDEYTVPLQMDMIDLNAMDEYNEIIA